MAIAKNIGIGADTKISNKQIEEGAHVLVSEIVSFNSTIPEETPDFIIDDKHLVEFYHPHGDSNSFFTKADVIEYESYLSYKISYNIADSNESHVFGGDSYLYVENKLTQEKSFVKVSEVLPSEHVLLSANSEFLAYIDGIEQLQTTQKLSTLTTTQHLNEEESGESLSAIVLTTGLVIKTK